MNFATIAPHGIHDSGRDDPGTLPAASALAAPWVLGSLCRLLKFSRRVSGANHAHSDSTRFQLPPERFSQPYLRKLGGAVGCRVGKALLPYDTAHQHDMSLSLSKQMRQGLAEGFISRLEVDLPNPSHFLRGDFLHRTDDSVACIANQYIETSQLLQALSYNDAALTGNAQVVSSVYGPGSPLLTAKICNSGQAIFPSRH